MLLLSGVAERRERERPRILALLRSVDTDRLAGTLAGQGLLALLGTRLAEIAPEELDAPFVGYVEAAVERGRRLALVHEHLTARLSSRLEDEGIPTLVLKGAPLARAIHGDAALRPTSDIDLLVRADDLRGAASELQLCGYRLAVGDFGTSDLPHLHYGFVHEAGWQPPVELHWRVHWYESEFATGVLGRSALDPDGTRRPDRTDELAMLLLFFARDGFIGLRYATDIAAWWDAFAPAVAPQALSRIIEAYPELTRAVLTAARQVERLVGLPASRLLRPGAKLDRSSSVALHLVNWSFQGDRDQIASNRMLVDWLLGPYGGKGAFARRFLIPSNRSVVRYDQRLEEDGPPQLVWRLTHGPKVLLRSLFAAWRVRGGRDWVDVPSIASATRPDDVPPGASSREDMAASSARVPTRPTSDRR